MCCNLRDKNDHASNHLCLLQSGWRGWHPDYASWSSINHAATHKSSNMSHLLLHTSSLASSQSAWGRGYLKSCFTLAIFCALVVSLTSTSSSTGEEGDGSSSGSSEGSIAQLGHLLTGLYGVCLQALRCNIFTSHFVYLEKEACKNRDSEQDTAVYPI